MAVLNKHETGIVLILLLVGFGLRIWSAGAYWNWYDTQFPGSWERSGGVFSQDGSQYVNYARASALRDPSKPSWRDKPYYRPPLASYYFVGLLHLCQFDRLAVSTVQSLLSMCAYLAVYLIGRRLFFRRISIAALAILVLHPVCIFYDTSFEDSSLALFLLAWTLFFCIRPAAHENVNRIWSGFLMGLTLLVRPNLFVVFFCILGYLLVRYKRQKTGILLRFAVPVAIVVLLPIWHNFHTSGKFSFIVDTAGENLFWGNNEHPYYRIAMQGFSGIPQVNQGSPERLLKMMLAKEFVGQSGDQLYKKAFVRYVTGHPWRFAAGLATKAVCHVSNYEIPRNDNFYFLRSGSPFFKLPLIPYSLLFAFMIFGVWAARPFRPELIALLAPCAAVLVTEVIFFNASRYRTLAVPFIVLPAAAGFFAYANFIMAKQWRNVIFGSVLAAALFAVGCVCVSKKEQACYCAASQYKAALEELYPDEKRALGIASVKRYCDHLVAALACDPDNLNAFSLYEKFKIMNGRIDEAKKDIARRAAKCGKNDPLCSKVCGFVDSLGTMIENTKHQNER